MIRLVRNASINEKMVARPANNRMFEWLAVIH